MSPRDKSERNGDRRLLAHRVVSLRCGRWSLSGHSGHLVSSRVMRTRPRLVFPVEVPCRPAARHKQDHFTISPPTHSPLAPVVRKHDPRTHLESGLSPRLLNYIYPNKVERVFRHFRLSSRIAASRNSDLVRNFGWHLMQKIAPTRKPGLQQVIGQSVHRFKPTSNLSTKLRCASTLRSTGPLSEKLENN